MLAAIVFVALLLAASCYLITYWATHGQASWQNIIVSKVRLFVISKNSKLKLLSQTPIFLEKELIQGLSDHKSLEESFKPIESRIDFNWQTAEPIKFRPFKPKYHLTMGEK